jgi:SPX domain protein involved in polyphosphate accumulation
MCCYCALVTCRILNDTDVVKFPYAVVEFKLQLDEAPDWLIALHDSGVTRFKLLLLELVEHCFHLSMFLAGYTSVASA